VSGYRDRNLRQIMIATTPRTMTTMPIITKSRVDPSLHPCRQAPPLPAKAGGQSDAAMTHMMNQEIKDFMFMPP
jgi:hypothetical protein